MKLGDKLIMLRRERGYSQEQFANLLNVSRQSVSKWESGQSTPEVSKLIVIADIFKVSVDSLIREEITLSDIEDRQEKTGDLTETSISSDKNYLGRVNRFRTYEYKSERKVFGIPLVHIKMGYGPQVARGIIAIGNISIGLVSIGGLSVGALSLGGIGLGLLVLAGLALGGIAIGGMAIGLLAMGGMAIGIYSIGGMAVASEIAMGGVANGKTAIGDQIRGENILHVSEIIRKGQVKDFILQHHPHIWKPFLKIISFFGNLLVS